MESATKRVSGAWRTLGRLVLAVVLAGVVGGLAAPARADDDRGRREHADRDRGDHDRDYRREPYRRPVYRAPAPAYVYAPPPVVYAPPPSGINLIFPLNIR
jgi:hypothetical protein